MTTSSVGDPLTTIVFELSRLKNPKTTAVTQESFTIEIFSPTGQLLEYLDRGLQYTAPVPAGLGISVDRNSTKNSQSSVTYTFTLSISFAYSETIGILLSIPKDIQCSGCLLESSNSTHY